MATKKTPKKKKPVVPEKLEEETAPALPNFTETPRERSAQRLMWAGVISFSTIIFALWSWSVTAQISGLEWNKAPEAALASKTKQEWNEIFNKQEGEKTGREATIQSIRDAIKGLSALATTSTATTSPRSGDTTTSTATSP